MIDYMQRNALRLATIGLLFLILCCTCLGTSVLCWQERRIQNMFDRLDKGTPLFRPLGNGDK
jgi:hypothetical protein